MITVINLTINQRADRKIKRHAGGGSSKKNFVLIGTIIDPIDVCSFDKIFFSYDII
jgi:hypothetical protein